MSVLPIDTSLSFRRKKDEDTDVRIILIRNNN